MTREEILKQATIWAEKNCQHSQDLFSYTASILTDFHLAMVEGEILSESQIHRIDDLKKRFNGGETMLSEDFFIRKTSIILDLNWEKSQKYFDKHFKQEDK